MRLSVEWLADHVDLSGISPERLGELLTLHVAEVEEVSLPGGGWPGVVVGHVREVRAHPDADKLRLVTVEAGATTAEVVCGAPNVAPGQKICYAPEGTTLPGGLLLKRRKIRGVESCGMVLSMRELGLGEDHEGILVLDASAVPGTPVRELLGGGASIEIGNTAITTRPDLWGHYGFAREIAALLERDLRPLDLGEALPPTAPPRGDGDLHVEVAAPDLCTRYLGWRIGGITVAPSPDWLRRRLEQAGQRPINNIVDLTNYIQLECGQPLHAFDRRQISGGRIIVRRAEPSEPVVTLDGTRRALPAGTCVIADPERPVAIAGVMGLSNSEVMGDTREIILEVAHFEMRSIRATAQALALRTDSAMRFEKGLDPEGIPAAARRFVRLLRQVCPAAKPIGAPCDVRLPPAPPRILHLKAGWIPERLGTPIPPARVDAILGRLGFAVARTAETLAVTVPSWRAARDVTIPEDLVEEVGRIHGYDRIEPRPLVGALEPIPEEPARAARRRARHALSYEAGCTEIFTYPFTTARDCERTGVEAGTLAVANAAQQGLDLLGTSLLPNLLKAVETNLKYRGDFAIYATGPAFLKEREEGLPRENERIALAFARRGGEAPLLEIKGALSVLLERFGIANVRLTQEQGPAWLHPGRCARLGRGKETYAWFGEIHPQVRRAWGLDAPVALADVDFDAVREAKGTAARMAAISRFPEVPYDVAVLVERRTPAAEVEAVLRKVDPRLVREVKLFDVYEGGNLPSGTKSLAYSITFGSMTGTLGPDEVEGLRGEVGRALAARGWKLRA